MMKYLQKLGKALMLPVAVLPICGILMGLGYALAPAAMGAAGATEGFAYSLGFFMIKAGAALIENMAILFAIGVGVGLSDDSNGTAGLAGMVSYLMITALLAPATVSAIVPDMLASEVNAVAFSKISGNAFTGILSGIVGGICYNKFKGTRLPDFLAFFSGRRAVAIVTAVVSIFVAAVLLFAWPAIFGALYTLGQTIADMGAIGAGIYSFLNRLLIPTGLHHALNNVFWFDAIGLGDLVAYWGGKTSAETGWSVGMYMAGFFPCMMFGVPGAALAMIQCAKPENRKTAFGIVGTAALCAFLCGVTEPFEFAFMFLAFPLYVVYALLYGIFTTIAVALGFRAGFCFSAGATDLIFSSALPAAANTWLILPLGAAAFLVFYFIFKFAIIKWNLKTPGREAEETKENVQEQKTVAEEPVKDFRTMAGIILEGCGGKENLVSIDHCVTRLRLELKDSRQIDEAKIRTSGCAGIVRPGKNAIQIIIGPKVQFVFDEFKKLAE